MEAGPLAWDNLGDASRRRGFDFGVRRFMGDSEGLELKSVDPPELRYAPLLSVFMRALRGAALPRQLSGMDTCVRRGRCAPPVATPAARQSGTNGHRMRGSFPPAGHFHEV